MLMSFLEKAIHIAVRAHQGQKDRYGKPFILHPLRMMMRMDTEMEKIVAVLHDVVEKSDQTLNDLRREGFPEEIVDAVDCLTKRPGDDYATHIRRARMNLLSQKVKIADLEDNMDPKRIIDFSEEDKKRLECFHKTWSELKNS
jgi:(p)ppGpp synthase/HD superfamily hydrolase